MTNPTCWICSYTGQHQDCCPQLYGPKIPHGSIVIQHCGSGREPFEFLIHKRLQHFGEQAIF